MSSFDDEYALFKQEIEGLDSNTDEIEQSNDQIISSDTPDEHPSTSQASETTSEQDNVTVPDIENELNYLKGHKCQAPYYHTPSRDDGTASYHNALVISVHTPDDGVSDINDIHVKVVFTHPICKPMLTCPFYFDGDCKYSEERCFFSHGYLVKFIELKEYKNISYDHLHLNQLVLAKNLKTDIWYRAKIVTFNTREDTVTVQFETGEGRKGHERGVNNGVQMELEHIYPLDSEDIPETESIDSESDDSQNDIPNTIEDTIDRSKGIEASLNNAPLDTRLGDWEKYTKGMGSKLMMKMGYVIGSGLGKNSEGRVEPVETYILPQGKSLDYCMNLREKCGGGEDMFKMEKMNKRITMRQEKRSKQNYEAAVARKEKQDVFGFLNKNLNQTSVSSSEDKSSDLNNANTNLNVETFKIAEKIKKYEKQLGELNKSLKRHETDKQSEMYKKLTREISIVNNQISTLNRQDSNIHAHMKKQFNKKSLIKF